MAPIVGDVALADELARVEARAASLVEGDALVSGIIATEPASGRRIYVCSLDGVDGLRSWLALDESGDPVTSRADLRAAVSIGALCEIAADTAGGGDLESLVTSLLELQERESPDGIEDAVAAARALQAVVGDPPRLATPARLDEIGAAARELERQLDPSGASPSAAALKSSQGAVQELEREIEAGYRLDLT
jgi:hypothetical protein